MGMIFKPTGDQLSLFKVKQNTAK